MTDRQRCAWAGTDPLMLAYHDDEWGVPGVIRPAALADADARRLSGWPVPDHHPAQAPGIPRGLRRLRSVGGGALFRGRYHARLLADPGIVRSRAKIEATIGAARIFCAMEESGASVSRFRWSFTDGG